MELLDPLRPLTQKELEHAVNVLKKEKRLTDDYKFISIQLAEPVDRSNEDVWKNRKQLKTINREAFIVLINASDGKCWEATVSVTENKVKSFVHVEDVQPPYTPEDYETCDQVIRTDPSLLEALKKRGINDINEVMVDLWAQGRGFIGEKDYAKERIAKPILYARDESDTLSFGYGRPIEGLTPIIDLNKKKIIGIEDHGVKPIAPKAKDTIQVKNEVNSNDFPPLKPIDITQPKGPSFVIDDHHLRWQGWDMKIGFNAREGLTLHSVQIYDREQQKFRKVLYRASCSEMVVPYADPRCPTYRRNAFDVGEEGLGFNANSLEYNCDCVGEIKYLDALVNTSNGKGRVIKNAICIHEEDFGVLWKHTDWRSGKANTARARRLVISFFATVANYDYGFYWYFYQDGVIQFEVKLTGLLLTTGEPINIKQEDVKHGTALRPGLSAPYHHHFFNVRMDMCVDGFNNSIYEVNCRPDHREINNVQGNAFYREQTLLRREFDAQRNINSETGRFWKVANQAHKNMMGDYVSYRLAPSENGFPYLHPLSPVMRRAGFIRNHLWVTPFDKEQIYSSSNYPNKAKFEDEGLPNFTKGNRSIENTSLVVWYTLGVLHIPRLEEWPIMSVTRASFSLLPDGFFNGNPSTYLRKPENKEFEEKACVHQSKL